MANKRNIEGDRLHHFELSDKNRTVRWVLIIILLAVAAVAIVFGLMSALQTPTGWKLIEPSSNQLNCSTEFLLNYDLGAGETSASVEEKALSLLYGQAAEKAWQVFYNEAGATEGVNGLFALNQHLNEELTVEPQLYKTLEKLEQMDSRALYFGPVYAAYDQVFHSADHIIAEDNDPTTNPDAKAYVLKLAQYANDPEAVSLELRGGNKVFLKVSEAYAAYLQENSVLYLLDFGWLRNAFVIDYLAQQLMDGGFSNGYLSSVDGFTRNLDQRSTGYSFDLYDQGKSMATMTYTGAISIAFMRSYPMYQENAYRYYTFSDGRILTPYVDFSDGQSKTAAPQLVSYSTTAGCAELAMAMQPIYATETLDESLLKELSRQNIHSVWFAQKQLCHTQQDLHLVIPDNSVTPTHIK